MRILVVEDEHRIAEAIKKGLEQERYSVDLAYTGTDGDSLAEQEEYDLIILDLMLPGMSGLQICKNIRDSGNHVPILILTAKSQVRDRVEGLDTGADDYLSKPFAFEELLARIRALLRRPKSEIGSVLKVGDIQLDPQTYVVKNGEKEIKVSSKEFSLLEYLMRHPKQILSKDQIINHVWDYEADILPNTVEVYIKKLRAKSIPIVTARGFGYRLG